MPAVSVSAESVSLERRARQQGAAVLSYYAVALKRAEVVGGWSQARRVVVVVSRGLAPATMK
jgi:hypothetical protein